MTVLREAANILDISEYDVLYQAYKHWYGENASAELINRTFSEYLSNMELPPWGRHYALYVIKRFEAEMDAKCKCFGLLFQLVWGFTSKPANNTICLIA